MTLFNTELTDLAADLLERYRSQGLKLAVAESCTGGLAAGLITSIAGASDVFDRGFITYSNDAKMEMIGVPAHVIAQFGAVSEETARLMAEGCLAASRADIALGVTGVAGPGGGAPAKPVGLVHIAAARRAGTTTHVRLLLGDQGRERIRLLSVAEMMKLALLQAAAAP